MISGDAGYAAMRAGAALGAQRPPLRLLRGGGRAYPRAAGWGRVAGGARLQRGGPVGGSGLQPCVGEAGGCGLRLSCPAGLGSCNAGGRARRRPWGGKVHVGCIRWPGGLGPGFRWCVRGTCVGHWAGWVCRGEWGSSRQMCVGCRVWGAVRLARREGLWRGCVGVRAGGGGSCRGAWGCARWWPCSGHWVGSEE